MRTPIGSTTIEKSVVVICDDGSVWVGSLGRDQDHVLGRGIRRRMDWEQCTPIPGTTADESAHA